MMTIMKTKTDLIPKKVRDFLETDEGKAFFAEISGCKTRQQEYDRLRSFLIIPNNVAVWVERLDLCKKRVGL